MVSLINTELIRALSNKVFRIVIFLHLSIFILVCIILSNVEIFGEDLHDFFRFGEVWHTISWIGRWLNPVLGVIIIILTGNEFTYGTFRQQFLCGVSKSNLLAGKGIIMLLLVFYSVILIFLAILLFGSIYSLDHAVHVMFYNSHFILLYILHAFAYLSVALFTILLVRKTGIAILLFLAVIFLSNIALGMVFPFLYSYFPVEVMNNLIPAPDFFENSAESINFIGGVFISVSGSAGAASVKLSCFATLFYFVMFYFFSWFVFNKKN
ncbi:MAG: hypothetical protein HY738_07840, partial [Bacteroidia bacterium]|nr:hypothetical protein [Bacteroidia bacterium]